MKSNGKRSSGKPVLPLPEVEGQHAAAGANLEQCRQAKRRQARANGYWSGRNRAMRRSARLAA